MTETIMQTVSNHKNEHKTAGFHLPGLFEFFDLYRLFLPLYEEHREYFYEWIEIRSLYGAPEDCIWGGGRIGSGDDVIEEALELAQRYHISARLTFSNSLLEEKHLSDRKCNRLCDMLAAHSGVDNGIIIYSDLLMEYLRQRYPKFYYVSSTTKVQTDFAQFADELKRPEFRYVVPDFRLNKAFDGLETLSRAEKDKVEFLCNECCWIGCTERKLCYENLSRRVLGEECPDHMCKAPDAGLGYRFSHAMQSPAFISIEDIQKVYLPMGFSNFKIEGRGLGSAVILEMLLYYLVRPEAQIRVREILYLDANLDLF